MNHSFKLLFIAFFSSVLISAENVVENECPSETLNDDEIHTFKTSNPYDKGLDCTVSAANGYKILITIKNIDIDSNHPLYDYFLIKPGANLEDAGDGKIFTHVLKKERSYVLFSNTVFFKFVLADDRPRVTKRAGFELTYQRIGKETITTTTPPPEENPLPQPEGNETIYLEVNIHGKHLFQYKPSDILKLRIVIFEMAKDYSLLAQLPVEEERNSYDNVIINSMVQCPWNWPDRDLCVSVRFSLPLHLQPAANAHYEMTRASLRAMWTGFHAHLSLLGLRDYAAPDPGASVSLWLIVIATVVVAFTLFLCVFKWMLKRIVRSAATKHLQSEGSEGSRETEEESPGPGRMSSSGWPEDWMRPDPYQTLPQLPKYSNNIQLETNQQPWVVYDNHSKPKPDINTVAFMDNDEEFGHETFS